MQSVNLPPVSISQYIHNENEPQMIQQRSHNASIIYLDAQDAKLELDKTNMILSSIKNSTDKPNILFHNIRRFKVLGSGIHWVTPNVNERNNNIVFVSSNTGATEYSVTVPEGFYDNTGTLMTAIVTAMNTVSGSSGLIFSQTGVTGYAKKFNLVSAGGSYRILTTCNAVTHGVQLWALPENPNLSNTNIVGSMGLDYTRWIDICSARLNNYTKIQTNTNGFNSNILFRVFMDDTIGEHWINFTPSSESNTINFLSSDSLTSADFKLYDQFGQLLYIPNGGGPGNQSGFIWDMQILVEF